MGGQDQTAVVAKFGSLTSFGLGRIQARNRLFVVRCPVGLDGGLDLVIGPRERFGEPARQQKNGPTIHAASLAKPSDSRRRSEIPSAKHKSKKAGRITKG